MIGVLSSYSFDTTTKKYVPTDTTNNMLNANASSALIPIGANVGSVTTLTPTLTPAPTIVATSGLVACIGIEFYQMVAGTAYILAQGNAMKIANVF